MAALSLGRQPAPEARQRLRRSGLSFSCCFRSLQVEANLCLNVGLQKFPRPPGLTTCIVMGVIPNPREKQRRPQLFAGWDCPLLPSSYPGFDCVSGASPRKRFPFEPIKNGYHFSKKRHTHFLILGLMAMAPAEETCPSIALWPSVPSLWPGKSD